MLYRNKKLIILFILIFIVLPLVSFIIYLLFANQGSELNEYEDPLSGETIYDPEGRTPEIVGESPNDTVIILGSVGLINRGLSTETTEQVKLYIQAYAQENKASEVSIDVNSIEREGTDYTYRIRLDRDESTDANVNMSINDDFYVDTFVIKRGETEVFNNKDLSDTVEGSY